MNRRASIGFDRRIDLEWLDIAAEKAAAGTAGDDLRAFLSSMLAEVRDGVTAPSARRKTVTVLNHIWGVAPDRTAFLRQHALDQLTHCTADERLALHWAMMLGTYPLFSDVAAIAGRILALHDGISLSLLMHRLTDTWGKRSTLERAAQRIARSMIQWGVLRGTPTPGEYHRALSRRRVGSAVANVMFEAIIIDAEQSSATLDQLLRHPALFPFGLDTNAGHVRDSSFLCVHRQGMDSDIVELSYGIPDHPMRTEAGANRLLMRRQHIASSS